MKKMFTLLVLSLTILAYKAESQGTATCNAAFDFTISGLSVKFTPSVTTDPAINHHKWTFGDGTVSSDISPVHVYASGGTYTVKHIFYRSQNSGTALCVDSVEKKIEIRSATISCNLRAKFSFERDPLQPNKVKFTNLSTPAGDVHGVKWSFGDGTYSSDFNASHVYTKSGLYKVCLIVQKDNTCQRDTCVNIQIQVPPPPCYLTANFAWHADSTRLNKIHFLNLSSHFEPGDSIRWTFGDGSFSNDANPTHIYTSPGTYKVCIRVKKNNTSISLAHCVKEICKEVVVVNECRLEPDFKWEANAENANKIHFKNLTASPTAATRIQWTFGDGTSSDEMNPVHTYARAGVYRVCLKVAISNTCIKEICKEVVVQGCRLEPDFKWEANSENANKIHFKNLTASPTAATRIQWTFGDGASSDETNPVHTYARAGIYRVCLKVAISSTCYKEICKTVEIKERERDCHDISKFSFTRSAAASNCLEYKFIPAVQNPDWKYVWTFGDGTGSTDITPSHVYQRPGNYTVFLTVYKSASCASTSHKVVETGACFSCNNIWAKYEYKRESSTSNRIYFHALSNYPILSQTWTITKLSIAASPPVILNQNNPVYVFNEPGDYKVCLKVVTQGGCVKEYCEVIHIPSPNTACNLTAYPNPTHNNVTVNVQLTQPEKIHVYIFNTLNILVKQKEQQGHTGNNIVTTNIEMLVPGWYTIKVMYGNRVCYSKFQKI